MNNGTANENDAFDNFGNRTSSHLSATYNYQPFNRMTATANTLMNYDANGNMVTKSQGKDFWRFAWDYENRMVSAATRKETVRYKYDALGRRIQRYFKGTKENTKFIYDGLDVVADDDSGVLTKYQNGPGIDNKLKLTSNGVSKYFLADHLGSTTALTDSSGNVSSSASYDSFGNSTNNLSTRYGYTGREFDNFTGLNYYRARSYDGKLGRFISEDPIGFAGDDINLYGYVENNPSNYSDPMGLMPGRYPKQGTLPGTNIPYRMDLRQEPFPNMHVFWRDGSETVITHNGGWALDHGGKPTVPPPTSYRKNLRPVSNSFLGRVRAKLGGGMGAIISLLGLGDGLITDYERWNRANQSCKTFEEQMCDDYNDAGPYIDSMLGFLPNPYQGCKGS